MLDDALKEEFRDEAEEQESVGKQFNATVSRDEVGPFMCQIPLHDTIAKLRYTSGYTRNRRPN